MYRDRELAKSSAVAKAVVKGLVLMLLMVVVVPKSAKAQYYDWGQDPSSVKWSQIKSEDGRVVFPRYFERQAVRMMGYMDTVRSQVGYGFGKGTMNFPLFLHTQNFSSNGLVVLAPRRMELIGVPPAETFAVPWRKHLSIHELRHNVHFSNINSNVFKVLGKIFGEHGTIIGTLLFPYWAMEGDAVLTETQFTEFGRGLQPSYTIDYRAMLLEEGAGDYRRDKFFSGSYKDHIPDHYHLGYHLTSWAYTRYGSDYWGKVLDYGTRRPYQLFTAKVAQRKYFGSSTNNLFDGAIGDLYKHWRSLPLEDNTAEIIESPHRSFTTYRSPIAVGDGKIVALKSDLDRTTRIVELCEETGKEKTLYRTGLINTPLSFDGERLWWSELRQSGFWEQRVNSQVCWYDLSRKKGGSEREEKRATFPVGVGEGRYAVVEYNYSGEFSIRQEEWSITLPDTISVHGLAWDSAKHKLYFIGLCDNGMWIGETEIGAKEYRVVTRPSYATLSELRASGGVLYYNSIGTGKDEIHSYDIATNTERQVTTSRYGSFSPSPIGDSGDLLLTTYTPKGYLLSKQRAEAATNSDYEWRKVPHSPLNPKRVEWEVMKIDSVVVEPTTERKVEKYRKGLNLFQLHSWLPAHLDPKELLSEREIDLDVGVTLMSQNLLNNTFATLGYKYNSEGSFISAGIKYMALAPKFELEAEYGFNNQLIYQPRIPNWSSSHFKPNNSFRLTARVYLPIVLSNGYYTRVLRPMVEFEHHNAKIFYPKEGEVFPEYSYRNGLQKMSFSLHYSNNVRMAHKDFLPRLGYALRIKNTQNPWNSNFGSLWSGYGRLYLPGVAQHHSLMIRGALQKQKMKTWNYRQKELFPRGADYYISPERYWSMSGDYQLPVWYPDGGIESVLYIKRVRVNVWGDYARYREYNSSWRRITSYGLDLTLDVVPFRLPSNMTTSITFSIRKPSTENRANFGFGISLPL